MTASVEGPCPTVIQIVGRPGTGSLPTTIASPDYPLNQLDTRSGSPSAFSRRAVVSYWRKYVHEVLVNRFGGLSLPRKSVARLTDRPDMTLDVYRGRKFWLVGCSGFNRPLRQYFSLYRAGVVGWCEGTG